MNYGNIIKNARQKQGMTQKDLAEAVGVTTRAIIYWETGQRKINLESADKIFKALHMSMKIGEEESRE